MKGTSIIYLIQQLHLTYDTVNNKVVVVYRDTGNSNYGTAAVGTVSGTDISFGTPVVFNSGNSTDISAKFDENVGKVVISYRDEGESKTRELSSMAQLAAPLLVLVLKVYSVIIMSLIID